MASNSGNMQKKALSTMSKKELQDICKELELEFLETDTNATLEERILESGLYASKKENTGGSVDVKDGKRVHKTLGKYIKVRVHPTAESDQKTSVFVSIGLYTAEFQPNEKIELPIEVVKFLKTSGRAEHYYDPKYISENGNVGAHRTRYVPNYIVEVVDEGLE